ncbi:MAG: SpoIIE family protein phosphatase [Chloroflexota bacterium]
MSASKVIEVGVAAAPHPGQLVSGDRHTIVHCAGGEVLVGLVDALGHGQEAAAAATMAVSTIEAYAGEPLVTLVERCHEKLQRMRGVAMSLAHFMPGGRLRWLSVGNVDGVLLSRNHNDVLSKQHMVLRGGVVGYRLPPLRPKEIDISPRDMMIMATDGIRRDFAAAAGGGRRDPQVLADVIMQQYGEAYDDALVLVVKYRGEGP